MDYQKVPVPVPGTSAWQPQLARLRTIAIGSSTATSATAAGAPRAGRIGRADMRSWPNTTWPCATTRACSAAGGREPTAKVHPIPETARSAGNGHSGQLHSQAKQATVRWGAT